MEAICRWCDGDNSNTPSLFHVGARDSETARSYFCPSCGFCFTDDSPIAQARVSQNIYVNGSFSSRARGSAIPGEEKITFSEKQAIQRFNRFYALRSDHPDLNPSVLEVGCGLGSFLALMAANGWRARGVEPDPEYSRIGSQLYNVPIECSLFEDAAAASGTYDLVASFHVLEHVINPRIFLQCIRNVLVPGGYFYLEIPTLDHPAAGDLNFFLWTCHPNVFYRAFLEHYSEYEGLERVSSGFAKGNYWGLFRKSAVVPEFHTKAIRPPIIRARALSVPSTLAKKAGVERLWHGIYLASNGLLDQSQTRHVLQQGRRLLSNSSCNVFSAARNGKNRIAHVSVQRYGNAGDTVLASSVRNILSPAVRGGWIRCSVHAPVNDATIGRINRHTKGIVIGAGGLFLADTNPNKVSGWQWAVSPKNLRDIAVPICIYAVGYNKFRGQDRLSSQFEDSLAALVEKSVFFGIRNRGSIRALSSILPNTLAEKITFQPCPTTILAKYLPQDSRDHEKKDVSQPNLVLNVAFDRFGRRYGARFGEAMRAIVRMSQEAVKDGWRITVAEHVSLDDIIVPFLDRANVPHSVVKLSDEPSDNVISVYRDANLVVGMRGHAQMIPFGLGIPIISLVAHDKLAWFLDDIGHSDWGVDLLSADFSDRLVDAYRSAVAQLDIRRDLIAIAQEGLWKATQRNLALISTIYT